MPDLKIPESELPRIEWIARLSDTDFQNLFHGLENASPTLTAKELSEELAKTVTFAPEEELQEVLKTLFAAHWLKEKSGVDTREFASDLASATAQQSKEEISQSHEALSERFASILKLRAVGVTAKALDVMTEHERVFSGARILTDMRPVFLDDGGNAAAAVVLHQLQLSFHQDGMIKELYFALDDNDLDDLLDAVEKAQRKSKVLEKIISDAKLTQLKV